MSEILVEGKRVAGAVVMGPVHVAARIESPVPVNFRIAHYPDGSKRIQGAYHWTEGFTGGLTWKDLPMVEVDHSGQAVLAAPADV